MPRLAPLAALLLASAAVAQGPSGSDGADAEPAPACEIAGTVTGLRLRARTPVRRALTLEGVLAVVRPIRRGLAAVRATLADGTAVEGTTRHAVPFELGAATTLVGGALVVRPGAAILDLTPIEGIAAAEVDVALAPGLVARGVVCPCDALRPVSAATPPALPTAAPDDRALPRWRPRVHDLHLRSGDAPDRGEDLHLEATSAELVLFEVERHRGWARVRASLPGGDVWGWTRDTDLAPAPRAR